MSPIARISPRLWALASVCALGLLVWIDQSRLERVRYVSRLGGAAGPAEIADARSPTGLAGGRRELIVPEGSERSFDWIAQTQQMFARGEARVRRVDYDNAPFGRDVNAASPYRWWLGLIAWLDHGRSGRPIGLSVERAALYADPLLHFLLVACAAIFAAWRFGAAAAALLSVGLVVLFPLASGFLPGMPDQRGLADICALGSILVLLAGASMPGVGAPPGRRAYPWFALAGAVGGLGVWISVQTQMPIIAGTAVGALIAAWVGRRDAPGAASAAQLAAPWRIWAYSGGATVLAAYLAEYFPGQMGPWRMESVHPAYGLAWIGAGELLAAAVPWIRGAGPRWNPRRVGVAALAAAALAIVPGIMWRTESWGFLAQDPSWARLSGLPGAAVASGLGAWLARDGLTPAAWATLLPLVAVALAAWPMLRAGTSPGARASIAVALGPVLVAGGFACEQLSWWGVFDCAVLALVASAASAEWTLARIPGRWLLAAAVLSFAIPGLIQLAPKGPVGPGMALTSREAEELIERHLAHWLERRSGEEGIVVYASPNETPGLCFYGGLRGIGSFAPENHAGFGAALNIAAAPTMEEAQGELRARGARYIVVPSWDRFFDEFAQRYLDRRYAGRANFFVGELRRLDLPPWLRAVPYQLPVGGGFEGQSVLVFEVVDEQGPAAAASRLAEYFVETGDRDRAAAAEEALRRFPGDVGALSARAQVQGALGDTAGSARTIDSLLARLSGGGDRYLPWDRRVSLAIVLAQAGRNDLSRDQARRCLADINEARLRSLTTGSLFDLLLLRRAFGLELADPRLGALALDLLPADLRTRL